jgi:hypothetical protein
LGDAYDKGDKCKDIQPTSPKKWHSPGVFVDVNIAYFDISGEYVCYSDCIDVYVAMSGDMYVIHMAPVINPGHCHICI